MEDSALEFVKLNTKKIDEAKTDSLLIVAIAFILQGIVMFGTATRKIAWYIQLCVLGMMTLAYRIRKNTTLPPQSTFIQLPSAVFEPKNMNKFSLSLPVNNGKTMHISFSS